MSRSKTTGAFLLLLAALLAVATIQAQTFTTLASFSGSNGTLAGPDAPLVQGRDGDLYGVTQLGGTNCTGGQGCGTVFKVSANGTITSLYSFCGLANCADGKAPVAGLALGLDGNFYGTTLQGGPSNIGTVFKITPGGALTTLANFTGTNGSNPSGTLAASGGNFYGTTDSGGSLSAGTAYKITTAGALTTVHNFKGIDGGDPIAGVILASDGNFYGTAVNGGGPSGSVFKMAAGGAVKVLHPFGGFNAGDGGIPNAGLVQGTDGNLYGTTLFGGTAGGPNGYGTVYKITRSGTLTILHSFQGGADGCKPYASLVQATDGNFYGTTSACGSGNAGTIFKITSTGTLTTLHGFTASTDGQNAQAGMVQRTDGILYGTTTSGGPTALGTIYSLSVGLTPFVQIAPTSGKVGTAVVILGVNLTGTTSVSFNGTNAAFTVVSDTEVTTTVPAGATTGLVKVTSGGVTVSSNKKFLVIPQITSFTPASGPAGTMVTITGVSLKQATSVKFNGKAAAFTVNSDTQITATVPATATTGKIKVTTPGGVATSTTSFTVT